MPADSSAERDVTSRAGQLVMLAIALFCSNYARTALNPLQEQIRNALTLTDSQIAILQGPALVLPLVLAAFPVGLLADRFSRARLIWASVAIDCGASIVTAFAATYPELLLARATVGLASGAISIGVLSLVADHFDCTVRGRANMTVALAEVAGAAGAFAAGGLVSTVLARGADASWSHSLLWMSAPLALAAVIMALLRDAPKAERHRRITSSAAAMGELWRLRGILFTLLTAKVLAVTGYAAVVTWAAPALQRGFSIGPQRAAAILSATLLLAGILGPLSGGILADLTERTGGAVATVKLLLALAIFAIPVSLYSAMPSVVAASVLLGAFTTVVGTISVIEMTLTTIVLPNRVRGLALSTMVTVGLVIGAGGAPIFVTELSRVLGGPSRLSAALTITCALSATLGAACFALGRQFLTRSSSA